MKQQIGLIITIIILVLSIQVVSTATEKGEQMKILNMKTTIGEGSNREVEVLFEGPRRKIVQITLRNNGILSSHKATEPITIQCISGKGKLSVGDNKKIVDLVAGVIVTIESNILHEIISEPEISVLLSKFAE